MFNPRMFLGSLLGLTAVTGFFAGPEPTRSSSHPGQPGLRFPRTGRRYPEQSSRQAMRRHRRANGGPGLMFDPGACTWERRHEGLVGERPIYAPF